MRNRNQVKITS